MWPGRVFKFNSNCSLKWKSVDIGNVYDFKELYKMSVAKDILTVRYYSDYKHITDNNPHSVRIRVSDGKVISYH